MDPSDAPRVKHAISGYELPDVFARLGEHVARVGRYEVARALGVHQLGEAWRTGEESAMDRSTLPSPFELMTFAWNDDIEYALVVHADDPSIVPTGVTWAWPDGEAFFLGDDPASALSHLLAVSVRDAGEGWDDDEGRRYAAEVREEAHRLAEAVGLSFAVESVADFEESARCFRPAVPAAPAGWTYEECNDGVGVLAPTSAFDAGLVEPDDGSIFDLEGELALADDLIARGFPASALAVARNTFGFVRTEDGALRAAAERMRACYVALGRGFLVDRVDRFLRG